MKDKISSTIKLTTKAAGTPDARIEVSSELMQNYEAAWPIDTHRSLYVTQDAQGEPMVFTYGEDQKIYLTFREKGGPTGWRSFDLTATIEKDTDFVAQAFAVSQNLNGAITLTAAVAPAAEQEKGVVYVSRPVSNDSAVTDWASLAGVWEKRERPEGPVLVEEFVMGTNDDEMGPPLILASTRNEGEAPEIYRINADVTDTSWHWDTSPIPQNREDIIAMAVGSHPLGRGVYALYSDGGKRKLTFTTLKNKYGSTYNIDFTLPEGINCLSVVPNENFYSDLYIAGKGVYRYTAKAQSYPEKPDGAPAKPELVCKGGSLSNVNQILVRRDDTRVAVWLLQGKELSYSHAPLTESPLWSTPLVIRTGVGHIAPLRNRRRGTNELVMVGADHALTYLYQEPTTLLWQEDRIPIKSVGKLMTFNCYTTHISLHHVNGMPITALEENTDISGVDPTVRVFANAWTQVTINGTAYVVDSNTPASVTPDIQGNITLINKIDSLATPIFTLEANFLDHKIDINPAAKVKAGLEKIKTGDDLLEAQTCSGQPLIGTQSDPQTRNAAAKAIEQLSRLADHQLAHQNIHLKGVHASLRTVALRAGESVYSACWGIEFKEDGPRFHNEADIHAHLVPSILSAPKLPIGVPAAAVRGIDHLKANAIKSIAGDIFEAIIHGLEKVGQFIVKVVGKTVEFIIDLGGKIFRTVIKSIQETFKLIGIVLKKLLGIDLEKIIDWLGFLFNWDDIKATHKVIENLAIQTIEMVRAKIGSVAQGIDKLFDEKIIPEIDKLKLPDKMAGLNLLDFKSNFSSLVEKEHGGSVSALASSPTGNFASYHFQHSGIMQMETDKAPSVDDQAPYKDLFHNSFGEISNDIVELIDGTIPDIKNSLDHGKLTLGQIFDIFKKIAKLAAHSAKLFAVGLFKLMDDLLELLLKIINYEIKIPFISGLYETVVGGKMTLLSGFCLLIAVPATIGYKLIAGRAPFRDENNNICTYKELMGKMIIKDHNELYSKLFATPNSEPQTLSWTAGTAPKATKSDSTLNIFQKVYKHLGMLITPFLSVTIRYLSAIGAVSKIKWVNRIKIILAICSVSLTIPLEPNDLAVVYWSLNGVDSIFLPLLGDLGDIIGLIFAPIIFMCFGAYAIKEVVKMGFLDHEQDPLKMISRGLVLIGQVIAAGMDKITSLIANFLKVPEALTVGIAAIIFLFLNSVTYYLDYAVNIADFLLT